MNRGNRGNGDLKLSLKWGDLAKNSLKKLKVAAENSELSATEKKNPRQPANPYPYNPYP